MPTLDFTCAIGSPFDVRRFHVHEAIDGMFEVEITGVSADFNIDLDAIVGQAASFAAQTGYSAVLGGGRQWSGIVTFAEQVQGMEQGRHGTSVLSTYRVRMAPSLWRLTQRTNHRIFQRISIPDIVEKVLKEWRVEPTWKIERSDYPKLEYKVQYGESDYAFVCRLLEEAGICFYFEDLEGETKLTLNDNPQKNPKRKGPPIVYEDSPLEAAQREYVTSLRLGHEVRPGASQHIDFDFRNPSFRLMAEADKAAAPEDVYEQFEYNPGAFLIEGKPGATPTADDKGAYRYEATHGEKRAKRFLESVRTGKRGVWFDTNVIDLGPGTVFQVEHHPHESLSADLLLTHFSIGGTHDGKWHMSGRALFAAEPYRPVLRTPRPKAYGVQSATVSGPAGQEIHVDEFGRVRVQFPWDREGKSDDESSVWMRVSQGWAGTGFGIIAIPRIGQEVLVGFLGGDPDDPIIVGRVYNAVNPVPYKLPENKTVSGWKTNSSPTSGGYNELKLEDKANKELIYVQAQKDLHKLVKRDWTERIERHHHRTVLENQHLIVKKDKRELIKKDDHLHVEGHRLQKIDGSTSLTVGTDQQEKIGNKHAVDAGKEIHLKAGSKVVLEAGSQLTIKGPGGHVTIHGGGIDIVGTLVKINSGGAPASGGGSSPKAPKDAEEAFPKDSSDQIEG
jgi:type VI secretion system secreted protein VgrG